MTVAGGSRRPPYKLFSLLLQYPDDELCDARAEIAQAIGELPRSPEKKALESFFALFGATPPDELRQQYVATFDMQKRSSLYLTFFTEGDTRKRGMALLRLKRLYAAAGFPMDGRELPDYLPAMLEFAHLAPAGHGAKILAEHRSGLELLRIHLRDCESPYAHLIDGVCAGLPRLALPELESVRRMLQDGPPSEEVGLQPFAPPEVMPSMGARR